MAPSEIERNNTNLENRYQSMIDMSHDENGRDRRPNVDIHIHAILAPMMSGALNRAHNASSSSASGNSLSTNTNASPLSSSRIGTPVTSSTFIPSIISPSSASVIPTENALDLPNTVPYEPVTLNPTTAPPNNTSSYNPWNALSSIGRRLASFSSTRRVADINNVLPSLIGNYESSPPTVPLTEASSEAAENNSLPANNSGAVSRGIGPLLNLIRQQMMQFDGDGTSGGASADVVSFIYT